MIDVSRICFDLPGRTLFDELSFRVNDQDRVAVVGPNGSGKTTLLKMMAGMLEPDTGQVSRTKGHAIGYLPQEGIVHSGRAIVDEARSVFDDLLKLKAESDRLETELEAGEVDEERLSRYAELLDEFHRRGGYEIDGRVAAVLDGLGFKRSVWHDQAETLSGGWQMRLALAKLLILRPELLLLDEPTNHLDLLAATWLEEFLGSYDGAFVLVSHDRHFLDNVVTHVAELFLGKARVWTGNYTHFLAASEKELDALEERKRRQDERIERVERFISKFRYQATKARQVQSRIKELEKIERIELPTDAAAVRFRFPDPPRSGRRVLELEGVGKSYGANRVFAGVDMVIERGDRLALVGPNGAGKSTLMRILAGRDQHEGSRKVGHNVSLAYFAQDEGATLDARSTVLEEVTKVAPLNVIPHLRSLMGSFLFRGDDVFKPIGVLSGGERTRVALARMLLEPHNLLLLDEPTNHLDLASKEVLLEALSGYEGTIVIVSHDRYFVDGIATRIADIGGGEIVTYPGGYEEYLGRDAGREHAHLSPSRSSASSPARSPAAASNAPAATDGAAQRSAPEAKNKGKATAAPQDPAPQSQGAAAAPTPQGSRHGRKPERNPGPAARPANGKPPDPKLRRENEKRRIELEKKIETVESEVKGLEAEMARPNFFSDPKKSRASTDRHKELLAQVKALYAEWDNTST